MYDRGLYPYTARYLKHFNNHFSTIGINGMNELLRNFTDDKENISTKFGREFALEMVGFLRDKIRTFQEESGNLYNLEATPAEGTTYRFAKEDKKRYPDIIQAGEGDNSSAKACKELVKSIISNYKLPYITITPVFSVCSKHGYIAGEHEFCPLCDAELIENEKKKSK